VSSSYRVLDRTKTENTNAITIHLATRPTPHPQQMSAIPATVAGPMAAAKVAEAVAATAAAEVVTGVEVVVDEGAIRLETVVVPRAHDVSICLVGFEKHKAHSRR
jgi:hypothetical protein